MATIFVLIAYWLDYKQDKKQFVSELKGGLFFLLVLVVLFLVAYFVLRLGILYGVFAIGIAIPLGLFIKYLAKK